MLHTAESSSIIICTEGCQCMQCLEEAAWCRVDCAELNFLLSMYSLYTVQNRQ